MLTELSEMRDEIRSNLELALHSLEAQKDDDAAWQAGNARFLLRQVMHALEARESEGESQQFRRLYYDAKLQLLNCYAITARMMMRAGLSKIAASGDAESIDRNSLEAAITACENGYNILVALNGYFEPIGKDVSQLTMTHFLSYWATACVALGTDSYIKGSRLLEQAKNRVYKAESLEQCAILLDDSLKWLKTVVRISEEARKQGTGLQQGVEGYARSMASLGAADRNYALMLQGKGWDCNLFCRN